MTEQPPPITGDGDVTYQMRIEMDRRLANFNSPITTHAVQRSIETAPLFWTGREEQASLFD